MEILVEILLELAGWIFQFLGEFLLQLIVEAFAEVLGHTIKMPFQREQPAHPLIVAIGYMMLGAMAGGLSLWVLPHLFIESPKLRLLNLMLTPVMAGVIMTWIGTWRRKRDKEVIALDRFGYAFCFALAMAVVRYAFGK